jgi:hypothetical protein
MCEVELGEYVEAHKPLDGFPKAIGVCEDRVKVRQVAKILIRATNVRIEEHNMFDSLVWVSTAASLGRSSAISLLWRRVILCCRSLVLLNSTSLG